MTDKTKQPETMLVDVAKLLDLLVQWHTEEYLDEDETEDYADRLLQRIRKEAAL
jgi:hypothetical protein